MKHLERALDGHNQFWRYFIMFLAVVIGAQMVGTLPLLGLLLFYLTRNQLPVEEMPVILQNLDFASAGIPTWLGLAAMLFVFAVMLVVFAVLIKPVHNRTLSETINGRRTIRWGRIWTGMIVWGVLCIAELVFSLLITHPDNFEIRFNAGKLLLLLLVSLLVLPFQTTCEEVLIRGYLAQAVASIAKNRWAVLVVTSLIFGLLHIANPEVKEFGFWYAMPHYLLIGLFFGLVAILDDGIELALGAHFINNAFAAMLVTHSASVLQTDAVIYQKTIDPLMSLITVAIMVVAAVYVLAKKYNWDFAIMNQKISKAVAPLANNIESAAE